MKLSVFLFIFLLLTACNLPSAPTAWNPYNVMLMSSQIALTP